MAHDASLTTEHRAVGEYAFQRVESDRGHDDCCRAWESAIDRLDDKRYVTSSKWSARAARCEGFRGGHPELPVGGSLSS